ncbi:SRA stem-loop-interacting RNA-binding protein, mitochondrial [Aix galericulata]|nr:SRA stem-loop-interacting RNA-binding protein, mitochondrial [Aix galericulata]
MAAASAVRAARRARRGFDIFVGDVPWTVSSKELKEYFAQFGAVQRCQLPFVSSRDGTGRGGPAAGSAFGSPPRGRGQRWELWLHSQQP